MPELLNAGFTTDELFGLDVARFTEADVERVLAVTLDSSPRPPITVMCANAFTVPAMKDDGEYRTAMEEADLLLPDGIGIVLAAHVLGGTLKRKFGGPDFLQRALEYANKRGDVSVFFLGAAPETLLKISDRIAIEYPGITVAGVYSPPFRELNAEDERRMRDAVNAAQPDILWVGISAPKQEKWIRRNSRGLDTSMVAAVGAAFDFFAGNKRRPLWVNRMGMFWLYRLITEPKRLGRRYWVGIPRFLLLLIIQWRRQSSEG